MFVLRGGIFPRLIALFPLLFPLYLYRGQLFGIPITLPEVLLGVLLVWFLLERYGFRWTEWKLWPVFLFLFAAILGTLIVPETATWIDGRTFLAQIKALGVLKGWILMPLLYFVMARTVFREKPSLIAWALRAMLAGGLVLSFLALEQVISGVYLTPDARASGPFESANYLALYLGPLLVYSILAFFKCSGKNGRFFLGLSALLCAAALFFTDSYAAWLAVLVVLALALLLWARRRDSKTFWILLFGLCLVGGLLVVSQFGTEKFQQFFEWSERSSSSVRIQIYRISLALIQAHPFFGIGLGQFEQQYQQVVVSILGHAPYEWDMPHPHNIFLALWLNMGLLGLVAFIWMCGKAFLWLTEKDRKERPLAAFMLLTLVIHGFFDTPYFKNDLAFQFWLLMAILL